MTTTTETSEAWSLDLRLGSMWFDLPTQDPDDLTGLATQVDSRIAQRPELAERRQELIDLLMAYTRRAIDQSAAGAALRWDRHDHDVVTVATLHTWLYEREHEPVEDSLGTLQARLGRRYVSDRDEPVTEIRHLAEAGESLRVQVISDPAADPPANPDAASPALATVQYWIPVPSYPTTLLLAFATPSLAVAEPLISEFDAIMDSLRIQP